MILADREKVERIFINLIGNAVKFTPEDGEISVSSKVSADADEYVISVKDSGIGIPPDQLEKVFEKFHQVEGEQYRSASGTGLGLAIAKHIVEDHGGKIWVESILNFGTTFSLLLKKAK